MIGAKQKRRSKVMTSKVKVSKKESAVKIKESSEKKSSKKAVTEKKNDTPIQQPQQEHLDKALVEKAVAALLKHHTKEAEKRNQLLGNDLPIYVQLGLEVSPIRPSIKPIRIGIPHSIHHVDEKDGANLEEPEVCLIVKEDSKPEIKEFLEKTGLKCVKKVLGLESLRKKYAQFQQRRELLHKFTHFMADDRILPMLSKSLGKDFVKAKKQPVPVRVTRKESLPFTILDSLKSTYLYLSEGTCIAVKVGMTNMPESVLVDNIMATTEAAVPKVPRGWANIRSVCIKTALSAALPVYNKTPQELDEIAVLAGLKPVYMKVEEKKRKIAKEKEEEEVTVAKKQKLSPKSPLVKALMKQKATTGSTSEKKSVDSKKKEESKEEKDTRKEAAAKEGTQKTKKKVVEERIPADNKVDVTKDSKKRKSVDNAHDDKSTKKQETTLESRVFLAANKFQGSKSGYVFRSGAQGLGYYVDVQPVVDKLALEALLRLADQRNRPAAGRKGGKKNNTRSSRSSGSSNNTTKRRGRR